MPFVYQFTNLLHEGVMIRLTYLFFSFQFAALLTILAIAEVAIGVLAYSRRDEVRGK